MKNRTLFLVDYCLTPDEKIPNAGILCENETIIGIGGASAFSYSEKGLSIIELKDTYALPGLIDTHVHGGGIFEIGSVLETGMDVGVMSKFLASHGITTFTPTLKTCPRDKMLSITDLFATVSRHGLIGSDPHGIHLDGPFLNKRMCGYQPEEFFSEIDLAFASELIAAGQGKLKLMTFAPELEHSDRLIELLLENGVMPSMGHSCATPGQTLRAIDAGARRCTDFYSSVPVLDPAKSSITDVALTNDLVSLELMLDGSSICRGMVDLTFRCKRGESITAISNSFMAPKGRRDAEALDSCWRVISKYSNIGETRAACCFTRNPARDLGMYSRGELAPGKRADIAIFNKKDDSVRITVSRGQIVFDSNEEELPDDV